MKIRLLLLLLVSILLSSCFKELNEEDVKDAILAGNGERLHRAFYKPHRIEVDRLTKVVSDYSENIKAKKLKAIPYRDEVETRKRKRFGYIFVDEEEQLHYSITFKYTEMKDGEWLVNFMDFRAAEDDIPSIKFPGRLPLRGVRLPTVKRPTRAYLDSLRKEGPVIINGIKIFHNNTITKNYVESYGDEYKKLIRFNFGNKKIKDNIGSILSNLSTRVDLGEYTFAYYESYAQPSIYIGADRNFSKEVKFAMKKSIQEIVDVEVKVKRNKRNYSKIQSMDVGGTNSDVKVRIGGWW